MDVPHERLGLTGRLTASAAWSRVPLLTYQWQRLRTLLEHAVVRPHRDGRTPDVADAGRLPHPLPAASLAGVAPTPRTPYQQGNPAWTP